MGQVTENLKKIFTRKLEKANVKMALGVGIVTNEEPIKDLNKEQLDLGTDALGNSLGSYLYFDYKGRWEPVDLLLTGDFRKAFDIDIDDQQTIIYSTDGKTAKLTLKYGPDIFGIKDKARMAEIIRKDFFEAYRDELNEVN